MSNAEGAGVPVLGRVLGRDAGADAIVRDALAAQVRGVTGIAAATAALLFDALAAIAFAAGLAGAVAALASSAATTPAAAGIGIGIGIGIGADHLLRAAAPWLALLLGAAAARGACAWAFGRAGAAAAAAVKASARRAVVAAALRGALGTTATPATSTSRGAAETTSGAFLGLAVDEVEALDAHAARFVPSRRAAVLAPLIVLFAAAFASPVAALILAATLLPFALLIALAGGASADESRRQFAALARLSGLFADRLRALPVVLACAAERRETERLAAAADAVATRTLAVLRLAFVSSAVLEFFAALCVALIAVYAGFQLLGLLPVHVPERLDLFRAFFVLALAPEFYLPMRRLAAAYHDRQAAQTATERLLACGSAAADAEPAVALPETAGATRSAVVAAPHLRVEGLTIQWLGADAPVVGGLSFEVAPGRIVALVGPSGSGKTSVLRALLGLAPVTAGGWRLDRADGMSLADANDHCGGRKLAALAAWVGQTPLVVPGTLRDNLRLVAPDADEAAVAAALRAAGLDAAVAGRAGGLDARLDTRGGGLSGGERRRLAVARALLKQAPLWLLDEPTAHLDAASEDALVATLREAMRGRTVLVATHSERLAAIADVVVRLGEDQR